MSVNYDFISRSVKVFSERNERELNLQNKLIERFDNEDGSRLYLVLNTELSRQILISKSFVSFNYFESGIKKYISKEKSFVDEFFQFSPIFQEGEQHHVQRKKFFKILNNLNSQIIAQEEEFFKFIKSRVCKIKNQLDFSKDFTRFFLIYILKQLLPDVSNKKIIKSIILRQNVWRTYFDLRSFQSMEKSLTILDTKFLSECTQEDERLNILLAQAFIIMGYDPLVATICASTSKQDLPISFASDSLHVCPTSYTTRICKQDTSINGVKFKKDSIVTISLVPTKNEINKITENSLNSKSLAYGLGQHMCIGKMNSFVILGVAEKVWSDIKKDIPIQNLSICSDGSFLSYKLR